MYILDNNIKMYINCGFSDCELDSGAAGSSMYTGYDNSSSAATG